MAAALPITAIAAARLPARTATLLSDTERRALQRHDDIHTASTVTTRFTRYLPERHLYWHEEETQKSLDPCWRRNPLQMHCFTILIYARGALVADAFLPAAAAQT